MRTLTSPTAELAKQKAEEVIQKWGRYTLVEDRDNADLVLFVVYGTRAYLGSEFYYAKLGVFAGSKPKFVPTAPLWESEAKQQFRALAPTKVTEKFRKYVEELEKTAGKGN